MPAPRTLALALVLAVVAGLAAARGTPAATAKRDERPLPAFDGIGIDGRPLSVTSLLGKRLLVLFFQPGTNDAAAVVSALRGVAPERAASNFQILGVAGGSDETALRALVLDVPVLRDPQGDFGAKIGLRSGAAALLVDADGYVLRGADLGGIDSKDAAALVESMLRQWLRLDEKSVGPDVAARPPAPDFSAAPLTGGGAPLTLAGLRGHPFVLIVFLHTCPHCHHALEALKDQLAALPEAKRPKLVAISVMDRPTEVEAALKEAKLDFFPVYTDADQKIRNAYGAVAGVPAVFGVDAQGRLAWRVDGWRDDRDPPLMKMRLALLAGEKPPMLLHATGYSGDEFCATCHPQQHDTWLLTAHSEAFDTLVRHGADHDEKCVGCHSVGFGKPGGYELAHPVRELEGVGCETCHGRGGPHLSPGHVQNGDYRPVCLGCHDTTHSLGFDYATFLPRISHAANAALANLAPAEKKKRLEERRAKRQPLLPSQAAYVGSEVCQSCHTSEHAKWAAHPHAQALATLEKKGHANDAECLACHTTGYGRGGFPENGKATANPALAGVGCESCHGPGGEHVKEGAAKRGTIVSLADKCDSCVILQVCGSCHDDKNDPGFEYVVMKKIQAQRHSDRPLANESGASASAAGGGGK